MPAPRWAADFHLYGWTEGHGDSLGSHLRGSPPAGQSLAPPTTACSWNGNLVEESVAQAFLPAAPRFVSAAFSPRAEKASRHECRDGRQECLRHGCGRLSCARGLLSHRDLIDRKSTR